jgi:phage gp36-like protein
VPYCSVDELLVGANPLPKQFLPQAFVDDAANEIDSLIGFRYITPVDIESDNTPVVRPARLLLKRLNVYLATGRLLMAMASNSSRTDLHPYGRSLVVEATAILARIASGEIILEGAPLVESENSNEEFTGPQIANLDFESNVESFYARIANPGYIYGPERYSIGNNQSGLVA